MSLAIDFAESQKDKGLWLSQGIRRIFVPLDKIGLMFAVEDDDGIGAVVTFTEEIEEIFSRALLDANIEEIKGVLPENSFIEIFADADEWGADAYEIHPYIVLKSSIDSYWMDAERVSSLLVNDAVCGTKILNNVTQLNDEASQFLTNSFGVNPDDNRFYIHNNKLELIA